MHNADDDRRPTFEMQGHFQMWLMVQKRQPGRALYSDLTLARFPRSARPDNFLLERTVGGVPLVVPLWSHIWKKDRPSNFITHGDSPSNKPFRSLTATNITG